MAPRNEIDNVKPKIRVGSSSGGAISYADADDLFCVSVEDNFGIKKSTAMFRYFPSQDSSGILTLNNGGGYKHGQRVVVYNDETSTIWFQGWLQKRQDQHAQNSTMWTAYGDRALLQYMPIRGALVMDVDGVLRYSSALPTSFNPNGAWNCTGATIGGVVYPVFTPTAYFGASYESPNEAFPLDSVTGSNPYGLPTDGKPVPWTPRRAMEYLHLWMYWDDLTTISRPDGMCDDVQTSINGNVLEWSSILGLNGIDPGLGNVDPLDRKLQPMVVQGDMALGALTRIMDAAGTHKLYIDYSSDGGFGPGTPPIGKSIIDFKPVGYTAIGDGLNLTLKINGVAEITNELGTFTDADIFDFTLDEDSTETVPNVVNEGAVSKVELRLEYDPADESNSTIIPAWTDAEQQSFLRCILGNVVLGGEPGKYAIVPKINGNPSSSAGDFDTADGSANNVPRAFAMRPEAVALARQSYPTVFRAWKLNPVGNLAAALQEPDGAAGLGYIKASRPILAQQLQFFTFLAGTLGDDRLRSNLPIRVSLEFGDKWYDVPRDTAVRVTADAEGNNLLWLDGLAETADGTVECLYDATLYQKYAGAGADITLKKLRINAAVPTDYRTTGISGESLSWRDLAIVQAYNGIGPVHYLDTPGAFIENLQYKSFPAANSSYYGGALGTTAEGDYTDGITRSIPPGSEAPHAGYAAEREFARRKNIHRTSTWQRAGIHRSPEGGDWIDYVYIIENDQTTNYEIRSSIGTVEWDFLRQITRVGNVFGEF